MLAIGISNKTCYKVFKRYKQEVAKALCDRSRRPVRYASQLPAPLKQLVVSLKHERPH